MIYWRQKVLLTLLQKAPNGKTSKVQFIKWLFLLKEEEKINRHGVFYDFLPYKYGPFSFLAYREISELMRLEFINSDDIFFQHTGLKLDDNDNSLSPNVKYSVTRIIERYGNLSQQNLINYVYKRYPWYASRSVTRDLRSSLNILKAKSAIYSLGYEGLSIDAFLNIILMAGIRTIVDVRNNPISRKHGFSKISLEKRCGDIGLMYRHFSEVGIPAKIRYKNQEKQDLWNFYIQNILPEASDVLGSIADTCNREPAVLVCYEKDPEDCHRRLLAREISVRTGLPVIHYRVDKKKWERE